MKKKIITRTFDVSFLADDKNVVERPTAVVGCCNVNETEAVGKGAIDVTMVDVDSGVLITIVCELSDTIFGSGTTPLDSNLEEIFGIIPPSLFNKSDLFLSAFFNNKKMLNKIIFKNQNRTRV